MDRRYDTVYTDLRSFPPRSNSVTPCTTLLKESFKKLSSSFRDQVWENVSVILHPDTFLSFTFSTRVCTINPESGKGEDLSGGLGVVVVGLVCVCVSACVCVSSLWCHRRGGGWSISDVLYSWTGNVTLSGP